MNTILLFTGRVGMTFDRMLLYVTGGGAWVRNEFTYNGVVLGTVDSVKQNRTGWTIGAGIEYGLSPNWSIAAQYNFIDLGDKDVVFVNNALHRSGRSGTPPRHRAAQLPLRRWPGGRALLIVGYDRLLQSPGRKPGAFCADW